MLLPTEGLNLQNPLLGQHEIDCHCKRKLHLPIPQIAKVIIFEGCALVAVKDGASVEILSELKHFKEELRESSG